MQKLLLLIPIIIAFTGCGQKICERTEFLMDTYIRIKVLCANEKKANTALGKAFKEIERIEKSYSCYKKDSTICQLNSKGKIKPNNELNEIMRKCIQYSQLTDGAFDITVYPLVKLWNFTEKKTPPAKIEIDKLLELVNYSNIRCEDQIHFAKKNMAVDLGGVVKGYAVDRAIDILRKSGINTALINAGGDVRTIGNRTWKIGLQHPRKQHGEILTIIPLKNRAAATSGDYERYFTKNNVRYHHILNPKTGYPANKCISVTITAKDTITADALSTGVFVLGPSEGMKLINKLPNIEGVIVDIQKRITVSPGLSLPHLSEKIIE